MPLPCSSGRILLALCISLCMCSCLKSLPGLTPPPPNDTTSQAEPVATAIGTSTGSQVSQLIGPNGGSIVSVDGTAELIIPPGALSTNTNISVEPITNNCPGGNASAYRFGPDGLKFNQPAILKFHYSADYLAGTIGDLMGIAFQDSTGIWLRFKDFSNDTSQKIISTSIKHFTDYAQFDMVHINPVGATLKPGKTLNLMVVAESSDDDLPPLPSANGVTIDDATPIIVYKTNKCTWAINSGIQDGDYGHFTSDQGRLSITYQAPGKVPSRRNPVAVSATIDMGGLKYHGKKFNKTTLSSNVEISDNLSFKIDIEVTIYNTSGVYEDIYEDGVKFQIDVPEGPDVVDGTQVTFSPFENRPPDVINPTGSGGGYKKAEWIPDQIGVVNIQQAQLPFITTNANGDKVLTALIIHDGAVTPGWKLTDQYDNVSTVDPEAIPGYPGALILVVKDSSQFVMPDIYNSNPNLKVSISIDPIHK